MYFYCTYVFKVSLVVISYLRTEHEDVRRCSGVSGPKYVFFSFLLVLFPG